MTRKYAPRQNALSSESWTCRTAAFLHLRPVSCIYGARSHTAFGARLYRRRHFEQAAVRLNRTDAKELRLSKKDDQRLDTQFRLMVIALIQDGMGLLDEHTEQLFAGFEQEGRNWREHVIYRLNGFDLPTEFIVLAIRKKWEDFPTRDVEVFTKHILAEWNILAPGV